MAMGPGTIQVVIRKNNVASWSQRLRARVAMELEASAQRTLTAASSAAPVRTGELADSGEVRRRGPLSFIVVFGVGLPDGRAIYQELGTSHHDAQPYLYPSFQMEIPTLMQRLAITTQGRIKVMPGMLGSSVGISAV